MGNCVSIDPPAAMIGTKTLRRSKFKKTKTYHEVLVAAGYDLPETALITLFCDGVNIVNVPAYKPFQFVDSIKYAGMNIPIKKLYGKQNGLIV
jgi:hypothetical protein